MPPPKKICRVEGCGTVMGSHPHRFVCYECWKKIDVELRNAILTEIERLRVECANDGRVSTWEQESAMNEFEENSEVYGVGNAVPDLRTVPEKLTAAMKLLRLEQAETRRLKAEVERLKGTLELTERQLAATVDDLMAVIAERDSQLAARDAMLASADRLNALSSEFTFYKSDGNAVVFVRREHTRGGFDWVCHTYEDGLKKYRQPFDTFDLSREDAIAAGWLKPSPGEAGTGGAE